MSHGLKLGWPVWIGVVAEDLERQRTFYRDVLGFQEREAGDGFVMFEVDGHIVELIAKWSMADVFVASRVTPTPGLVRFTTANPMNSAAVVTISK